MGGWLMLLSLTCATASAQAEGARDSATRYAAESPAAFGEIQPFPPATTPAAQTSSDKEIRFGMVAPFTGPAKELGSQMKGGVETAFDAANDLGGINGRMLRLVTADDGYDPARTLDALKQLRDKNQILGLIGDVGTPTAAAALPYVLENHLLFYGAFTGAGLLRNDPPDRYVVNYRASYVEETDAVVRYLVKVRRLHVDQIAVFAQQDSFGDAGYAGVEKAFRALSATPVDPPLRLGYVRNTVDVAAAIDGLRKKRQPVKAIVMVATYRAAAKFIEKTRDLYPDMIYTNVSFVGSTALSEELTLLGSRYVNGVIVTQVVPAVEGYSSLALEYRAALAKYFPSENPDYVSFEGYVETKILIEAMNRAGPQVDVEKLVDAIEGIHNLDIGLGAPVVFGRAEHQGSHKVWGTQLDANGKYQPIDLQ
jgi:branched-chain amino acid transport system substrate-binding protein